MPQRAGGHLEDVARQGGVVLGRVVFAERDLVVYASACPSCGEPLEFHVSMPPIPMTFLGYVDDDGRPCEECPACGGELFSATLR